MSPGPGFLLVLYIGFYSGLGCLLASHSCSPRRVADGGSVFCFFYFFFYPYLTKTASIFRGRDIPYDQSNDVMEYRTEGG
ncbi:uncharacterized protein BO80DRAFT_43757 [Aspergillus ibericus CBS 121593]|uniref:Uncharacterized protein n=1 Tax=Aspergillus ibericus CBS 121593 TaxID=1448316 RepID=A0A395H494_9EURO|nr:hypothetical protein BO80DRAFT_43757 [Aspergillus ibericus CBS 121593]RAL02269.1 hypothetical protein BO80DRAFT_43757 [Aspergillus ibericus CBS 121593]